MSTAPWAARCVSRHDRHPSSNGAGKSEATVLEVCGREVRVSSPGKVYFPEPGLTKMDLIGYYLECEEAVVRHLAERPTVMKRWWMESAASLSFRSAYRTARRLAADRHGHFPAGATPVSSSS